ncbi:dihydroorotate dehydrogenase electron transfer subunit [Mesorhizobium sp. L-8-3]|uniref:dihydroorotate dehydrogenase electron transfer subunit n=1 Tax=Mesorhizobium sp. L-8-3 TaxID=2744522 RepID=UPI001925A5CC|nr:dihydroorotate dehydrogenase electron transfer subunit [Mesorhizobium sp. L-8-3]BCH21015.1 dihydroorotate dehydrogenase B (NAD(+)), electron transfer subunit [Mesorhizobium sp. L-8-3]
MLQRSGQQVETGTVKQWQPKAASEIATVVANQAIAGDYRHLALSCGPLAAGAQPGQFFQLLCPQPPGEKPFLRRPMSIYATTTAPCRIEFLYKIAGAGTRGLETLDVGDSIDVFGPLGVGFTLDPQWRHIVVVGRGAGLATLAPLARAAADVGIHVTAVLSARRPDLLVSVDLFHNYGADVIGVTDMEATSGPANVEKILRGLISRQACDAFFTCGSSRLMRVQQRLAAEFGIPGQVALEQQMACGIGLCYCCVRDFNVEGEILSRRVCWDGPVFDLAEAMP